MSPLTLLYLISKPKLEILLGTNIHFGPLLGPFMLVEEVMDLKTSWED